MPCPASGSGRDPDPQLLLSVATATAGYLLKGKARLPALATVGPTQRELQIAALRRYAARGDDGSLLPPTDAVIAIRAQFLRRAINRSLPFRQYFADGRYVARIDSADVRLEPGLAKVTLMGRGMQAGQEDSPFFAGLFVAARERHRNRSRSRHTGGRAVFTDVHATGGAENVQAVLNPSRTTSAASGPPTGIGRGSRSSAASGASIAKSFDGDIALAEAAFRFRCGCPP
jgi:hypothetical protein